MASANLFDTISRNLLLKDTIADTPLRGGSLQLRSSCLLALTVGWFGAAGGAQELEPS